MACLRPGGNEPSGSIMPVLVIIRNRILKEKMLIKKDKKGIYFAEKKDLKKGHNGIKKSIITAIFTLLH